MRKAICLIIALSLVFGAVLPVYAVTETQVSGFMNPNDNNFVGAFTAITQIISGILNFKISFENWALLYGDGTAPTTALSFQDLMASLLHLQQWLVPSGSMSSNFMSLWDYVWYIAEEVSTLWGGWDSYFSNLTILPDLSGIASSISKWNLSTRQIAKVIYNNDGTVQVGGVDANNNPNYETGDFYRITQVGINAIEGLLGRINNATLAHYNDTLTTWEHSNLTQTSFTPSSLANGLYRYLAYIQSDTSDLDYNLKRSLTNISYGQTWNYIYSVNNSHASLTTNSALYTLRRLIDGSINDTYQPLWSNGSPIGNIALILKITNDNICNLGNYLTYGFKSSQTYKNILSLNNSTFTPTSAINGIYNWLKYIQEPTARLAFVLANDEEIAARNAAKNDQNAVINNFVASTGGASATVNDYADIAGASASFKSNYNTGYSISNVWDIFTQDHYGWFTQTTANSLDTTVATREVYETPLLDEYYHEIYSLQGNNEYRNNTFDYMSWYINEFNRTHAVLNDEDDNR